MNTNMKIDVFGEYLKEPEPEFSASKNGVFSRTVVRVKTTYWGNKAGVYTKRSITYLRRKCIGFNSLEEEMTMTGADGVVKSIVNLDSCPDGVYQVVLNSTGIDREAGLIDEWDWKLIPYE